MNTPRQPESSDATVDYFDRLSSGWSDRYQSGSQFAKRLELVLDWVGSHAPSSPTEKLRVLDYGCGSGRMLAGLIEAWQNKPRTLDLTGVDVSPGMIASARRQIESMPAGSLTDWRLECIDGSSFDGRYMIPEHYDVVLSLGVLEYIEDDERVLHHLCELMKTGGHLIVSMPNRRSLLRVVESIVFACPTPFRWLGLFSHLTGPDSYLTFQHHQYRQDELARFLARQGLEASRHVHFVAPNALHAVENSSRIGMTFLAEFMKRQ